MKWRDAPWADGDVVLACHLLTHDAPRADSIPTPTAWEEAFVEAAGEFPRYVPTLSVCYPCVSPELEGIVDRYASIDFFTIRRPQLG